MMDSCNRCGKDVTLGLDCNEYQICPECTAAINAEYRSKVCNAIVDRRSIRHYTDQMPSDLDIGELVESVCYSPTACDRMAWQLIIIKDKKKMREIVDQGGSKVILNAPVGILMTYSNQTDNLEYHDDVVSAGIALQNIMLTAHTKGLGTCVICHLPPKPTLRHLFKLPETYDPIAYVCVGYPSEKPKPKLNHPEIEDITNNGVWEQPPPTVNPTLPLKRAGRKIYYLIPFRKYLKPIVDRLFEKRFD